MVPDLGFNSGPAPFFDFATFRDAFQLFNVLVLADEKYYAAV